MRWATTTDEPDGLFPVMDLFADEHGSGRMSQLEFLPVLARSVIKEARKTSSSTTLIKYKKQETKGEEIGEW